MDKITPGLRRFIPTSEVIIISIIWLCGSFLTNAENNVLLKFDTQQLHKTGPGSPQTCNSTYEVIEHIAIAYYCPKVGFRRARLEDMVDFYQGLSASSWKKSLVFTLDDKFENFVIVADFQYLESNVQYFLTMSAKKSSQTKSSVCVRIKCPPPPTSAIPTHLPTTPLLNATMNSVASHSTAPSASTGSFFEKLIEPRARWFTTSVFLGIICLILLIVVIALLIIMHRRSSSYRNRRRSKNTLCVPAIHVPKPVGQQQQHSSNGSDSSAAYFGDIERRKLRSQELRRSHSETSSITTGGANGGSLPRGVRKGMGGNVIGSASGNGGGNGGPVYQQHHMLLGNKVIVATNTLPSRPCIRQIVQYPNGGANGGYVMVNHNNNTDGESCLNYNEGNKYLTIGGPSNRVVSMVTQTTIAGNDHSCSQERLLSGVAVNSGPSNSMSSDHTPISNLSNVSEEDHELL